MKEYVGFISNMNDVCIDEKHPIVRCRDCIHYIDFGNGLIRCCDALDINTATEFFCALGERKEDE